MVTKWIEVELLSLSDGGMQNGVFYEVDRKGSGIPLINVRDMYTTSPITEENLELFNATDNEIKNFEINDGDLFFTRSSIVPNGIAFCNWYKKTSDKPVVFDSHVIRFKTDKSKVDPMFLYLQCISPKTRKYFIANAKTATMTTIDQTIMGKCIIDLPPLPEQRRIAKALSDTDALLTAMEKLIAKKRAIKQGAMQELLTGKRRLPGFEGAFVKMNLVANSTLKARIGWQGLTTTEYQDSGYSYLITGTDFNSGKIMWDTCHYVDKHRFDQDTNIQVVNGDILITKDGTIGKVAIVNGLTKSATLNSGVFVLRSKGNAYDHRYVYYVLLSQIFIEFLDKLAAGSTINHLYQKDFMTFEFDVPPTLFEQTTIAEILSDMDEEIDALTVKLHKLRHIKQGMMSELLTGRIRLIDQEQVS